MPIQYFSILLLFFVVSCQTEQNSTQIGNSTQNPKVSYQKKVITNEKNTLPLAIILYASDSPNEFTYFSTFFTHKLNQEKIFHAIHQHDINQIWIQNAQEEEDINRLEPLLKEFNEKLKQDYKNQAFEKMIADYKDKKNDIQDEFLSNTMDIKKSILAEFYFWSSIAQIKNNELHPKDKETDQNSKLKFSLFYYKKLTSISEKSLLEYELDTKTLDKIQNVDNIKTVTITISTTNKCTFYANGIRIKGTQTLLPWGAPSALTLACNEGDYSKLISPTENHTYSLRKFKSNSLIKDMPAENDALKKRILQENADYLTLIYWSKELKKIDIKLFDVPHFKLLRKETLRPVSEENFDSITQKLLRILREKEKPKNSSRSPIHSKNPFRHKRMT
jgi:hypothetical protein